MKLSKREIVLLTLLVIIALIMAEFYLIISPGTTRLNELTDKNGFLDNQINSINLDLTLAKTLQTKRDQNLLEIDTLAAPFLSSVSRDALLVFTHEMMIKHGFLPITYSPSPNTTELLQPEQLVISQLTYRLKEIADQYRQLGTTQPTTETTTAPSEPAASSEAPVNNDLVELYTLQVTTIGSYDQIKALLDDFESLGRTIIISNINMTPKQTDPTIPDTTTPNLTDATILDIEFFINYYGIEKLKSTKEPLNDWTRETMPVSTEDPFIPIGNPTPTEPTTGTTVAGG